MNKLATKNFLKVLFLLFIAVQCAGQTGSGNKKGKQSPDNADPNSYLNNSTIKVAADPSLRGNGLLHFLVGKNYRKEWTQPVTVPVLNMKEDSGGLKPKKTGGGKETKSLQVKDKKGREWALRSVKKYPENAIPPDFRKTIAETIVKDDISASYPYGALSMEVFSKAAGVPYLKDRLTYIPDDPLLDTFRKKFKNTLVLMEERTPEGVDMDAEADEDDLKTVSTEKLIYELAKDNDNKVDELAVLRARLLDNFVMDFDRHEGQWIWIKVDTGKGKLYYPVPKDRDQVFYTNQGLLPRFARSKGLFPELQGFRAKAKNIRTFNRAVRNFDRFFLTGLSESDWSREIDRFLKSMTDSVIETALKQQPAEIQGYTAQDIIKTLKKKRRYFKSDMMKYYRFLSNKVAVVGTNKRERFTVNKNKDRSVQVTVEKIDSLGNISSLIYDRFFNPRITKEIQLYGLENDDEFIVNGTSSPIKIRLIGGPGNDHFINNSRGKVKVYDVKFEENTLTGNHIKSKIKWDEQNNRYDRLSNYYSMISPGISLEYSSDGGIFLGPKLKIVTQGFRKDPYATTHTLSANRALNSFASYHFKYEGEFINVFGRTDVIVGGDVRLPSNKTNFFGLGNNTLFEKTNTGDLEFYHTRYNIGNAYAMLRTPLNSWLNVTYGPVFHYFKLRVAENANKFVAQYLANTNPAMNYDAKYFTGGEVRVNADTRNNMLIPTRGVLFNAYARKLYGLNKYSSDVSQAGGSFAFYTDFLAHRKLVFAASFGGDHNIGNFDFEQAQYLGFKQNLRGFRIQRFAGRSRAYNNVELRYKVGEVNAVLFPVTFGLLGFNDIGRVWVDGEKSDIWHDGYGGGIWVAALNKLLVTGSLTYSKEEKNLALLTFGFQF